MNERKGKVEKSRKRIVSVKVSGKREKWRRKRCYWSVLKMGFMGWDYKR